MRHSRRSTADILTPEHDSECFPTPFELAVLTATIESERPALGDEWVNAAMKQAGCARITQREFTQHGMYADLAVEPSVVRLMHADRGPLGSIVISIPSVPEDHGVAGANLFVSTEGLLDLLEIWSAGDHGWPFEKMHDVVFNPLIKCSIRIPPIANG